MNGNLVWVGGQNETIKQQSGITSTENESVSVSSLDSQGHGASEDTTGDAIYVGISNDKIHRLNQYTTPVDDDVDVSTLDTDPAAVTTNADDDPLFCGWGDDEGMELDGYSTTTTETIDLSSLSSFPQSFGYTGVDVLSMDGGNLVLTRYSGWTTTVSDSVDVSSSGPSSGRDLSQDADNTLVCSDGDDTFYEFDGICTTTTVNNSLDRSAQDNNISGVDTDDASGRNFETSATGHPVMRRWGGSIWPTGAQRIGVGW